MFIRRTDAEAPMLWPPDMKSRFIRKDSNAGKDRVWQEQKRVTEDEMVAWHRALNGHESEQTLGDSEGQGSLVCCHSWGHKELDTNELLNNDDDSVHSTLTEGRRAIATLRSLASCLDPTRSAVHAEPPGPFSGHRAATWASAC